MTRLSALVALCVVMLAASLAPRQSAAQVEVLASRSDTNFDMGGSSNAKFPGVAGVSNQVAVAANPGSDAKAWQKQDSAGSFGDPVTLGDANGQADYANAAVTANRFNNTFHAVWIDQDTDRIYYRTKGLTGDWSGSRIVISGTAFRVFGTVGVSQDGRIYVAWSQDSRIRYRTSSDGGASWDSTQTAGNITPLSRPFIAGGPGNRALLTFGSGDGNIYAGLWNGSSFEMARITNKGGNDYFSNPTATITPNGTYYVAWRDGARGVYYSERQSNGSWPSSRVAGGPIVEAVPIASDESNNITLMWTGTASGRNDVYYAFKPAGQAFGDIVRAAGPGGLLANMGGAATLSDRAYGHGVVENFTGGGLRVRYFRFSSDAQNCLATVTLANGADVTNSRTLSGTITPPAGCSPTQMRIGLNTQDPASAPLQTYSSTFTVTVPEASVGLCTQTVNVRLLAGGSEGSWSSDTVKVDPGDAANPVGAAVSIEPYGQSAALAAGQKDLLDNGGSSSWDAGYVREPQVTLRIQDTGECAGLNTFTGAGKTNEPISALPYTLAPVTLPGPPNSGFPTIGPNEVPLSIVDKAGNAQTFRPTIIFDPSDTDGIEANGDNLVGRPVWAAGSTIVSDTNTLSTLRTLTFSGVKVGDNLFDPAGVSPDLSVDDFWGVWLAVQYLGPDGATAPVEPDSTTLSWVPVKVQSRTCTENGGCAFTVRANLFSGLNYGPDTTKAGVYRVFVRMLDGAGNPSVRAESLSVKLDAGYQLPTVMLPVLSK